MFGSNKNRHPASNNDIGMIIGKDTQFKGTINSQEVVRVDGSFEGDIVTVGTLIVGEKGRIKGEFVAQNATIAGTCEGNLTVAEKLELLATGKLFGDVKTGSLVVENGAIFQGTCSMSEKKPVPSDLADNNSNKTTKKEKGL